MTLLEPLVKGVIAYCKWFISAWTDDKFDFNSFISGQNDNMQINNGQFNNNQFVK